MTQDVLGALWFIALIIVAYELFTDDLTQALKDYIAELKEELEDAEERPKEVEKSPER